MSAFWNLFKKKDLSEGRRAMKAKIDKLAKSASDDIQQGKLSIVYTRLQDLRPYLPGTGNNKFLKDFKHWKLVIRLGFDSFILEFVENSLVGHEGLITVEAYNPGAHDSKEYPLADLRMSKKNLFGWIALKFERWAVYNLVGRNCHHFVRKFLKFVQEGGFVSNETNEFRKIRRLNVIRAVVISVLTTTVELISLPMKSITAPGSSPSAPTSSSSPQNKYDRLE
ncbi:hypothetical protein BGX33_011227 [Mortierella sp. NVP41]|nr:hypothetical protein BGX33_011227 [Mortierella sp. NVP41]